jgi:hypothetical protein
MAGIKHIAELYKKLGESGLREVLNKELRITEKFDAFRFSFEKNSQNYKLYFYGKNGKTPINKIDRTLSDLYEGAIDYIESLPYELRKDLPIRHRFGFSWFPTKNPLSTDYERRPKNGLVLTDITIRDKKNDVTRDVNESEVYRRYAKILGVEYAEPLHVGKLDESVIESLISIAKNKEDAGLLTESFDTKGYLNQLHPNIEAMIFESEDQLFKISHNEEITKSEKRSHMFDLLLMDILEHIETFNILGIKCASTKIDEAYIEAVSEIFNDYVDKRGKEYLESNMEKPRFLSKSGKFNKKLIKNPKTRMLVEKDTQYEYLLSVFLANLRKPKFASGLLNESTVHRFNSKIEEIDKAIGDDYSFLEFTTIIKEEKEEQEDMPVKGEPDYVKAVHLLTKVFDPERKLEIGKEPINVLIINAGLLTNRIKEEAERLYSLNKNKCILIHCEDLRNRYFGADEKNIEKIIAKFVTEYDDLFAGYYTINRPILSQIINKLRPKYEPMLIHAEFDVTSLQKELEGTAAIYSSPSGLMKSIKVAPIKDLRRKALLGSLESDAYKDFTSLTPSCVHPYWKDIKSSFDKYTFK